MKQKKKTVQGKLSVTSKGFGFVGQEDGPDLFVPYEHLGGAIHGDVVEAAPMGGDRKRRPSGKVTRIIERSSENIVGVFRKNRNGGVLFPEDARLPNSISVPDSLLQKAGLAKKIRSGHVVVAHIDGEGRDGAPVARIERIVGDQDETGMDLKVVALSRGLSLEYPEEVETEAHKISRPDIKSELKRRRDLRQLPCYTIDPQDAKDFDDAVSLRQLENGLFELGVHIADVSHYVTENSPLDKEAWKRATSVYFVKHVIPMLPERLSNDICSLVPGKERLAFSVLMQLDSLGNLHDYTIEESVIKSARRYTYAEVEEILGGKSDKNAQTLHLMQLVSQMLRKRREEDGSIDFDMTELLITLDKEGIPREISPKERLDAHRLVEEFMLLANRTVASHIETLQKELKTSLPFIYRVHEAPAREDVESFLQVLSGLGIRYRIGDTIEPDDYRNILRIIENLEFREFVETIALRSMTKAVYATENAGHFGLAFDAYTHFTSPIRRYPDLAVHRLVKRYGGKKPDGKKRSKPNISKALARFLEKTCTQANEMERVAVSAEREYTKIKSMEFLSRKVGNVYDGVISGVASFGLFVEIEHYMIEGLVAVSAMSDDYYKYDADNYQFVGEKNGKVFRLGDRVTVKVKSVSVDDKQAEFVLV